MIDSLIYRYAGVPADVVLQPSEIEIKRNLNIQGAPSVKELREEQQKADEPMKPRWWGIVYKPRSENTAGIDWKVEITLPDVVHNAQWSSICEAAQNVKIGSIVAGIGFLVVGAWKSIPDRSPLKALVTIIMTFAAAYFAKQAQLMEEKAAKAHKFLNSLNSKETVWSQVRDFRMTVIEKGLSQISSSIELLPKALEARAIELLTDDEIKDLFEEHIQKLKNDPSLGTLIFKDDLLESFLKKLPETNPFSVKSELYGAIQACNKFKRDPLIYDWTEAKKCFAELKTTFELLFNNFEKKNEFLNLFYKRYKSFNEFDIVDFDRFCALRIIFSDLLGRLCNEPTNVKNFIENQAIDRYNHTIAEVKLKRILGNVFSQIQLNDSNMDDYDGYIKWAHTQVDAIPEEKMRNFLKSCLPQKSEDL